MKDINDLRRERTDAANKMNKISAELTAFEDQEGGDTQEQIVKLESDFQAAETNFNALNETVTRMEKVEAAQALAAKGNMALPSSTSAPAKALDPNDKGIDVGLMFAALTVARGDREAAVARLEQEGYSGVSAALTGAEQSAGGVTIPRPTSETLIGLLRPKVAVRASGAKTIGMPAGEMRYVKQTAPATASYIGENAAIPVSQPEFGNIDQKFKKLASFVPVGNSLARHSFLNMARLVRDDVVSAMALREDLAFLRGDGTGETPKGLLNWIDHSGANWISSVGNSPAVVEQSLRKLVSLVDDANVSMLRCGWIMRAATKHFLESLRDPNSGQYIFASLRDSNVLLGYPVRTTSQLPTNLGEGGNETEVIFADFNEIMIGDSMNISFGMSDAASYVDANGNTMSAFQNDLTVFRAIAEHDIAPARDEALAGLSGISWSL